jgi:hypothetical protein
MNKLTALSKLASAYHYVTAQPVVDQEAAATLMDTFGYIRRSLRISDMQPQPKCTEGLNPAGPKFF